MAEDDDLNLPRAAINKMIKETLPQVRSKWYKMLSIMLNIKL